MPKYNRHRNGQEDGITRLLGYIAFVISILAFMVSMLVLVVQVLKL